VLESMRQEGIDTRIFFPPLSDTPVFQHLARVATPHAHDLSRRAFNLPSYHELSITDQGRVIDAVLQGLSG